MTDTAAWLVGGLVLAALEMVAPGVFLLWIGLAAAGTGLSTLLGLRLEWQLAVFVVLAAVLVGLVGLRLARRPAPNPVNDPAANLVGRQCRALGFADGEGRVALGDGQWRARLTGLETTEPGQALRVVGLDGTVLLVAPW